jgi:peptidoglycan/xylan/chitin deacetylase (PgdA/CDA1 family)/GT2 family glycosyltransferase/SAM-dependent methyltransferase
MNVSVIIPAYNGAATLEETLKSLQAQTLSNWEAIVIDDGSQDETVAVAAQLAEQDSRIRLFRQANGGVCSARNRGIQEARFDWLLFLDADDWVAPDYLEKMTGMAGFDPSLDLIHCGWTCVAPDGTLMGEKYAPDAIDLFPFLARNCTFAIHACIVRRALVEAAEGFSLSLPVCEDWDLWQRLARTGIRFGAVREILAFYRMRPNSLSRGARQLSTHVMWVLDQGHSADPRVSNPDPRYAQGQPREDLAHLKLSLSSWLAGFFLGEGKDARPLLTHIKDDHAPELDPNLVATNLFESVILSSCHPPARWHCLWTGVEGGLADFLTALESQSQASGLAARARKILEILVLRQAPMFDSLQIGATYGVRLEITEPIDDILPPEKCDRLYCQIVIEGTELGRLELPVIDGKVSAWVIKDAIAAQFSWPILGKFFEHTHYAPDQVSEHDALGWTIFLQQLWGKPDWKLGDFYDSEIPEEASTVKYLGDSPKLAIEVSEELYDVSVNVAELNVMVTVGGVAVGAISLPVRDNFITARTLRVAVTVESGLELCRVFVRDALLGCSLRDSTPLRSRLAKLARTHASLGSIYNPSGPTGGNTRSCESVILGRHMGSINSIVSRRVMFPATTAAELVRMAQATQAELVRLPAPGESIGQVIYAPDRMVNYSKDLVPAAAIPANIPKTFYDRGHFETLFSRHADPWKYTSPYEQVKYEQTLSLLPETRIPQALELACAEGHFTGQLAPFVDHLIAADISQVALERAAERHRDLANVSYEQLDLVRDCLPGRFGLIVCSEVLYYVGGLEDLKAVARKIAGALEPDGYFLMAHANQISDEPDRPGFDWGLPFGAKVIGEAFAILPSMYLAKAIQTPLYRVQLFRRYPKFRLPWRRFDPEITVLEAQPAPPPPEVEAHVRWEGGRPSQFNGLETILTDRLPILMYHRVAPSGLERMRNYRVTPEAFEEQLRYLKDGGFYSVSWEQWQMARSQRKPLPGRGVMITFDDGYLDFFQYAWPLLKQYGFTATVFIVADQIGKTNIWDQAFGEELPLMGWPEIHHLQGEGIEFGSHSTAHHALTALSNEDLVRDLARSRAILQQGLGAPTRVIAYPHGDFNPIVEHFAGGCGYTFGVTCRAGSSQFNDSILALPRIEVMGSSTLREFVNSLSG